ncbi:hypothetical protein [Salisediminibacterium beveridgei]|uniref:Uncharacterized protein n=1 Tax=Salisediminibacterium beveridgei TaxID=632773 RepID=A0A1D7QSS8_9BACI|nr:hypothetical protein [Salisediminibacterium beveridgei]AOM82076.1 hypothetical protein BBEV_0704 [Salisediminibacterium beveridgei]
MDVIEIALFTILVIVFGIPFALKVRYAAAIMQQFDYDRIDYQQWMIDNRQQVLEKVELIYVVSLLFFFLSSPAEGLMLAVVTVMIHGVYLIRLAKGRKHPDYSPEIQRLIGTVYVMAGLFVMLSIVLAAFLNVTAGFAVLVFLIWYAFSLIRVASGITDPVEDKIKARTMEDAKRLISVHPSLSIVGFQETANSQGLADRVHDGLSSTEDVLAITSGRRNQDEIATQLNLNLKEQHSVVFVKVDGMNEEALNELMQYLHFSKTVTIEEKEEGTWLLHLSNAGDEANGNEETVRLHENEQQALMMQAAERIVQWLENDNSTAS